MVKKLDEKRVRLMKLIEHWAEHNDEHGKRYKESAEEAKEMGLVNASMELQDAHLKSLKVSTHLRNALSQVKEDSG
jgi:hypothetical protein